MRSICWNMLYRSTARRLSYLNATIDWTPRAKSSPMLGASVPASTDGQNAHMASRLLDRQARLLEFLTSAEAIFGDSCDASRDPILHGFDRARLHIEARFSHDKRMEKIAAVFPKTFDLLGDDRDAVVREFTQACPPVDISRLENARQFHDFLSSRWENQPPTLPYLVDVTACELACAQARLDADDPLAAAKSPSLAGTSEIRRKPGIALLRTRFDIRPVFKDKGGDLSPVERMVPLAI